MDYFCQVAGCRTVPVELGARYTDEEWSQQLMTVSDFISQYITAEVCYTPLFHLQHGTGTDSKPAQSHIKGGVCCKHSSELKGLTYFQDLKLGIIIATIGFTYNQMYSSWNLINTYIHMQQKSDWWNLRIRDPQPAVPLFSSCSSFSLNCLVRFRIRSKFTCHEAGKCRFDWLLECPFVFTDDDAKPPFLFPGLLAGKTMCHGKLICGALWIEYGSSSRA